MTKTFLTLTFVGMLIAGVTLGTLVEGTGEPIRQGALLGFGLWLTIVGIASLRSDE